MTDKIAVLLGWMEDAQRLPLSKLVLTGERHYTRNDDIRQSILALGEPGTFMTQDVNIIQTQIEQRLPWIKQVSVRKQWPDELKIHLVEYVPIARWNDQHMVDAEGNTFSVPPVPEFVLPTARSSYLPDVPPSAPGCGWSYPVRYWLPADKTVHRCPA